MINSATYLLTINSPICIYSVLDCAVCSVPTLDSSDIRIVGGRNRYEGRVEVNRSGEWQTVCDDSWDIEEAEVVCRQLGYGYAILERQSIVFGWGSDRHWMRDWSCHGNETNLDDCRSSAASVCDFVFPSVVFCSGNGKTYLELSCLTPPTTSLANSACMQL